MIDSIIDFLIHPFVSFCSVVGWGLVLIPIAFVTGIALVYR